MADDLFFFTLFTIGAKKLIGASGPLTRFAFHLMSAVFFLFYCEEKTIQRHLFIFF